MTRDPKMNRIGRAGALALALVLLPGSNAVAAVRSSEPTPAYAPQLPAYVELEVAESVLETDLVRSWATEAIDSGLQEAGVAAASDGRRLSVSVAGAPFDYEIQVGVQKDAEWIGDFRAGRCKCDDEQLVRRIRDDVLAVSGRLRPSEAPATNVDGPAVPAVDGGPAPSTNGHAGMPLRAKGKAGVGLLAVGASGVIAGAVLLAIGAPQEIADDDASHLKRRDLRPAGASVLAVGAAAVAVGAVLLGLDRRDAKRKRAAQLFPSLAPRAVGITITGRF